jgi:RNA polymerase sigma factor (sigma-70 family)
MAKEWRQRLVSANDALLAPLIESESDAARAEAMEAILEEARPMIRRVMSHARTTALNRDDLDDVESTVRLRLFRRLELARLDEEHAVRSLDEFIAKLTYNAIHDLLRRRFPERTRLKARLRYLLTHDRRLALWNSGGVIACGLATWRDRAPVKHHSITRETATAAMVRRDTPGEAMLAVFGRTDGPLLLEDAVDLAAALWGIVDTERPAPSPAVDPPPFDHVEARQYLTVLWSEIRELRAPQRVALLLNLRDDDGLSPLVHLVGGGIATMEEIAAAIGVSAAQLTGMWDGLPLADSAIAEMLGLTRQQVINLRKSARERLTRRMR